MRNAIALIISLLMSIEVEAQIKIRLLDACTREPIAYASAFNVNGDMLVTSNTSGYISLGENIRHLSISHIAYINKDVDMDTLRGNELFLVPREQVLNEVAITTKRPEYVVLEAYFRAPQFYNGQLEYYYDGVAYYFVKLKNGEVDHCVLLSRYLVDDDIKKIETKEGSLFSYTPPIPIPGFNAIKRKKEMEEPVCRIDTLFKKVRYSFDNLYPDSVRSLTIGKYHQQLRNSYSSEIYNQNPSGVSYTDIVSGRWSRRLVVKHKDIHKVYDQWEEIYITHVSFADKAEKKILEKGKADIVDVDQYIEQFAISPISNGIKEKLLKMTATSR